MRRWRPGVIVAQFVAVPAAQLGLIQRGIGGDGQFVHRSARRRLDRRDAEADRDLFGQRIGRVGAAFGDHHADALGDRRRAGEIDAGQDQHELLAALPRGEIDRHADARLEHVGDRLQRAVALVMAVRVVEALEPVDVDRDHRQRPAAAQRPRPFVGQPHVARAAIGEPGQRIGAADAFERVARLFELAAALAERIDQRLVGGGEAVGARDLVAEPAADREHRRPPARRRPRPARHAPAARKSASPNAAASDTGIAKISIDRPIRDVGDRHADRGQRDADDEHDLIVGADRQHPADRAAPQDRRQAGEQHQQPRDRPRRRLASSLPGMKGQRRTGRAPRTARRSRRARRAARRRAPGSRNTPPSAPTRAGPSRSSAGPAHRPRRPARAAARRRSSRARPAIARA